MVALVSVWSCTGGNAAVCFPNTLQVTTQPGNGYGGDPLLTQPIVQQLNTSGLPCAEDSASRIFVEIKNNPAIYAGVNAYNVTGTSKGEPFDPPRPYAEVTFEKGIATFSGLYITMLGSGFTLNFVSIDLGKQIESGAFNILLGPVHTVLFEQPPGTARGGEPFIPQPRVRVADRGYNTVITDSTTSALVEMISRPANQPKNGTLTSTLGAAGFYAKMTNGVATFIGLKIDIAGFPYALRFSVDHPIFDTNGQANYIDQVKMTVGVGKAVVVEVARHPSFVIAGKTFNFSTAPVLNLLDSGGNLLVEDFTSTIEVSIHINPSAGRLDVSNLTACTMYDGAYANCNQKPGCIYDSALQKCKGFRLTVPVYAGVAQFDGMLIDKVGPLYQLKYTATADPLFPNPYQWTGSIFNLSPSFNVLLGVPKSLKLLQAASDAWAGGTPFQNQPIVALLDGGENIVVTDSTNIVTATLYINPTGYPLLGVKTAKYDLGIATFQNLAIEKHGEGYGIKYTTSVDPTFEVSQFVAVRYATEFQLSSNDKQPNDRFGFSNDIQLVDDVNSSLKDMAVVGAPYEDRALDEIQVVQTEGTSSIYVSEVQTVSSSAWHRNEIQVIQTIGIPKTSLLRKPVVGYGDNIPMFKLRWRNVTTRLMEADVSATQLAIIMQEDLKSVHVGWIDATRSPNVDCGCEGGYNWKITFRSAKGFLPILIFDDSVMNVTGSYLASSVKRQQDSTTLSDYFRLSFPPIIHDGYNNNVAQPAVTSSPIPFDATAEYVENIFKAELWNFTDVRVTRSGPNNQLGFVWSITYIATQAYYNPPLVISDGSTLGGYGAKLISTKIKPGRAPLGGTFRLSFREDVKRHLTYGQWATTTSPIPWNASASDMKAALEALQSISEVNVERRDMNFAGGFSWTIVFNKVAGLDSSVYPFIDDLDLKQYSFLEDTVGNLAPLVANETMLTGTDATVRVHEVFSTSDLSDEDNLNIKDTTSPSLHLDVERRARKGNHGRRAGAAYVFTRVEERWPQEFKLLGHDTDSYDQFGTSVSVSVDTVAVGAPGAENYGQASKKSLECSASKGYFTLSYQGQTTAPFDASTCTLSDLLQGLSAISSLGRVVAVNSDNEIDSTVMPLLFCNESAPTTFTIRISSPNIKESLTSIQQLTANVAPLYFPKLDTATEASPGSIKIVDVQLAQGLDNFQTGAVYTFKRNANGAWNEETKIMPSGGQPGDEFGGKVILRGDTIVATALEDDRDGDGAGAVYHFYKSDGSWKELQKLGFLDHECGLGCYYSTQKYQGLQFGYSLALQGNTLIVGGYPKTKKLRELNQGEVYVYKRNSPGGNFLPEQIISDVSSHIGDAFGYTLSIHENTLVVGAPYRDGASSAEGAVVVFERTNVGQLFYKHSQLKPNDFEGADRFGITVGVELNTLIASYHEEFPAFNWRIRKSVQAVTVTANSAIGGHFYVTWRVQQFVRPSPGHFATGSELDIIPVGTRVEARFGAVGTGLLSRTPVNVLAERWYPGRVTRSPKSVANTDGTYGIQYENGLWEPDVTRDRIRRINWLDESSDHRKKYRVVKTTRLPYDIAASALRDQMQNELGTGKLSVDRIGPDSFGGYTWRITFQEHDPTVVPPLGARSDSLTGSRVQVRVKTLSTPMLNMRKGTVIFTRDAQYKSWTEQGVLSPGSHQGSDLFGAHQIGVRGTFAIISAANRDTLFSGNNAGAAFMFNLNFLSLKFEHRSYAFSESSIGGGKHNITVLRCSPKCHYGDNSYDLPFEYQIGDGLSTGLQKILVEPKLILRGDKTCPSARGCASSATGRGDCLRRSAGSQECLWLPSSGKVTQPAAYDPLGLSDYAPHYGTLNYPKNDSQLQVEVIITDDHVYESPNEMFNVRLLAPGFQPSYGGNLWSDVTVEDDGDGGIGAETYFDLLESSPGAIGHQKFGYSVSAVGSSARKPTPGMYRPELIEDSGDVILAVGMPYAGAAVGNMTHSKVGEVHMYEKTESTGMWTKVQVVTCPTGYNQSNIFFGTSVSLHNKTMVVGTPGLSCAFVYRYNTNSSKWLMEEKLSWSELDTMDRYGDRNAVAVWNNWIVVGAKGAEAVFIYKFNGTSWVRWQRIRQDYNETVILRTAYRNHKDYGAAVAMWSDTLLVGAPKADHSHQTYADDYATKNSFSSNTNDGGGRPTEKGFHGRGIVYQYLINVTSGMWELQTELQAKDKQAQDNFGSSIAIDQDYLVIGAPNEDMKARSTWDFETGNLVGWHKTGDAFDYQPTLGDNTMGRDVYGHTVMAGEDTTYYTRKQYTGEGTRMYQTSGGVADSVRDPAGEAEYTYTESIRLPTFAYKGNPSQRSGKRGKYWIGTYEKRHDNNTAIGNVQGDIPTGTLTSDPFMIGGTEISFLVGGGCRINEVWVELFVDGESGYFPNYKSPLLGGFDTGTAAIPVYRVTGKCTETMHRVTWNVGEWIGKIGQIRIVDMSTMLWAHINVDDFQFDWDNNPATNGGAGNIEPCSHGQCGHHYGESSGAAYVYRRVSKARTEDINGLTVPELCQQFCDSNGCFFNGYSEGWGGEVQDIDRWQCYWYEEQKFQASDKRENDMFGNDVAIDFGAGIVLVGAPGGRIVDLFNRNSRSGRLQTDWAHTGGFTPNTEKTNFPSNPNNPKVGRIMGFRADDQPWRSGSIYLFTRWPESRAGDGRLTEASKWNVTEKLKTQSPAKLDRDHLGFSVALVGYEAFAGAPKEPATYSEVYKQVGSVAYFNLRIDLVRFRKQKWVIQEFSNENDPNFIDVYIDRIGDLSKSLSLKYATSDITATGTPPADYEICMKYYKSERGECGDYVEQSGTITWGPGQKDSAIRLFAIDDFCPEAFQEVFKLSLFLPGGDVLVGKEYTAYVVIEDDDEIAARAKNKAYCKRQASPVYSAIEN